MNKDKSRIDKKIRQITRHLVRNQYEIKYQRLYSERNRMKFYDVEYHGLNSLHIKLSIIRDTLSNLGINVRFTIGKSVYHNVVTIIFYFNEVI